MYKTPRELGVMPGDFLECMGWEGRYYTKGRVYPVVKGFGVEQQAIGMDSQSGKWRIVRQASLEEQVKELLG